MRVSKYSVPSRAYNITCNITKIRDKINSSNLTDHFKVIQDTQK